MSQIPFQSIYVDPQSPSHLRATLAAIKRALLDGDLSVASIADDLDYLEELTGFRTMTFAVAAVLGQPLFVESDGEVNLANAGAASTARVVGVALADTAMAATGPVSTTVARVERSNWTSVTGTEFLTPGATYFLDATNGMITATDPDSATSVEIGVALSTTVFLFDIQPPILL